MVTRMQLKEGLHAVGVVKKWGFDDLAGGSKDELLLNDAKNFQITEK